MAIWWILWAIAAVVFLAADAVWLGWISRSLYVAEIGPLLRQPPNFVAAGLFYALYITCLVIMVLKPAHAAGSVSQALFYGAVFGLAAYGTYDLTNLAVMKGFTTKIALIDMAWGSVLTGLVSAVTVYLARNFQA